MTYHNTQVHLKNSICYMYNSYTMTVIHIQYLPTSENKFNLKIETT